MIPVNLITGFLGVGKTTVIRHLLTNRPDGENWAVLVNEFGEMGVDGSLLDEDGVAIEEVAGGCLCCVAAPAFTVGLNRLIRQYRPDRILIEPSGIGHPAQVLKTLNSVIYQDILKVQATLCVLDARHLSSVRHREHPSFIDQIHLSDILIANKADLYKAQDKQKFMAFAAGLEPPKRQVFMTEHGQVGIACLSLGVEPRTAVFPEAHAFLLQQDRPAPVTDKKPWLIVEGQTDGYYRAGWQIDQQHIFDRTLLTKALNTLEIERIKGLFRCTEEGMSYNQSSDKAEIKKIAQPDQSQLQLIHHGPIDVPTINAALLDALKS